ncbi:MAG TPA: amino acid permease [Rhizomicrobium sp.]|jgi:AAT family amino acid transporter/D-serine/D-alanine/glycine transporter
MAVDETVQTVSAGGTLHRALTGRHLQFIAIGGAIGSGLFLGSAAGIRSAGPALLIAYIVGGAMIFFIARALGEMALAHPKTTTMDAFAEDYIHPAFGFLVGWNYWMSWILVGMVDITAMAIFVKFWFPDLPQWIPALISLMTLYGINLCGVRLFGELEFWMALVKVVTILGMMVAGIVLLFQGIGLTGTHASLANIWNDGGLFPTGAAGFLAALPIAFFAFGGSELVGLAAAEARDPERSLPGAINGVVFRILIFYIGSLTIIMALVPWRLVTLTESPFVLVFTRIGLPATASLINLVLISAVLSSCNSGLFAGARTLQSLATKRHAPAILARIDNRGVPVMGISISAAIMFIGVILNYYVPGKVMEYIISASAVLLMGTWTSIIVSHMGFRRRAPKGAPRKFPMPLYPFASWVVLFFIGGIALIMATVLGMYIPIGFAFGYYILLGLIYVVAARRRGAVA